jgi:hypothetical protein
MAKPFSKEKKQLWKENILKQRQSGLSVAAWCRQNNFNVHTFGYWQGKIFPKKMDHSSFTEIKDKTCSEDFNLNRAGIVLEYQGIHIHLDKEFDSSVLRQCLAVVQGAAC